MWQCFRVLFIYNQSNRLKAAGKLFPIDMSVNYFTLALAKKEKRKKKASWLICMRNTGLESACTLPSPRCSSSTAGNRRDPRTMQSRTPNHRPRDHRPAQFYFKIKQGLWRYSEKALGESSQGEASRPRYSVPVVCEIGRRRGLEVRAKGQY